VSRPCTVCTHDRLDEVEAALAAGESMRALAASYGLSARSLARHLDAGHAGPRRPIAPHPSGRPAERSNPQKSDTAATRPPKGPDKPAGVEPEAAVAAPERLAELLRTDPRTEAPRAPQTEIDWPMRAAAVDLEGLAAADAPSSLDLDDPATQMAVLAALAGRRTEAWLDAEAEHLRELRGEAGPAWQRRPF
jgi:hypothetical protein